MAIVHENKVIEKLLIEQDKYKNQLSMYQLQEQELSDEMRTLQNEIDSINSTRLEILGQIKAHNVFIEDLDTAIRLVEYTEEENEE